MDHEREIKWLTEQIVKMTGQIAAKGDCLALFLLADIAAGLSSGEPYTDQADAVAFGLYFSNGLEWEGRVTHGTRGLRSAGSILIVSQLCSA